MKHRHLMLALAASAACDAQLTPSYTGESLLTIVGSVEASTPNSEGLVIPALAFQIPDQGAVEIQELNVQGKFPSNFRLDVFEPPPEDAYFNATHDEKTADPRVAVGYITAVSTDHPKVIHTTIQISGGPVSCDPSQCDQPCGGKGCLAFTTEYCVGEDSSIPCYRENVYCPTFTSPPDQCTTEEIGDPRLKDSPWHSFAGLSQNYLVVFLEHDAPEGSVTASLLGTRMRVPAGYGLYSLQPLADEKYATDQACKQAADVRGAGEFNQEWGTDLSTLDFETDCPFVLVDARFPDAGPAQPDFKAPFCTAPAEELDRLQAAGHARDRYEQKALLELGCLRDFTIGRIANPPNEPISVFIGARIDPARWPF